MRRRFLARMTFSATALCSGLATAGCAMGDHSNTLLFGTNTNLGIQVGRDATSVASINVGYRRQEAVYLPLLANLKDAQDNFVPCPGSTTTITELVESCKFLARNGQSTAEDGYSVLASFGATFSAGADTGVEASGGLAQYFATGAAAQILAIKGGAAVVAVGPAATASAEQPSESALVALVSAQNVPPAVFEDFARRRTEFADHLQMGTDAAYVTEADRLSGLVSPGTPSLLRGQICRNEPRADCIARVRSPAFNEYILDFYDAWKMTPP